MCLASVGARRAAFAAGIIATLTTCRLADVFKPPGLENTALSFTSDSVLVVAAPTRPSVVVTVNGAPFTGARVRLASSDTVIVAVRGDTLVPKARGTVTLTVTLESSALPRTPPSLERSLLVVADTVTLDSQTVRLASLGDTVTLVATARDALGAAIASAAAHWSSSDTNVVTVTSAGRLTANANGTATLRAMVDRDTAALTVTVAQVLTRWTFEPASLRIDALSDTASVAATGHDARGNPIGALAPASWSVGDASIAAVSGSGQVTSLRNGATHLYVTRGAVRDSVPVTVAQRAASLAISPRPAPAVTSLGAQLQLTARSFDRKSVEIQGAGPSWFTLDPGLVRVSTDGLVTALAIGTARIIAALDAAADTATVAISNDPATLTVAPDSALATSLGDTLIFRAVARNGRGDSVAATPTWRTPDSTIVNLLSDGRAIALAVGTARVIATVSGRADTGLAKVTNVPTAIDIAPVVRAYTSLGDVDTLAVTITNARGGALPSGSVTWTSDDPLIARVSAGGIVTARDTGQTVVRAASGAVHDSVVVTVQNVPASLVVNSPAVDTLTAVGQSLTLPVEVRNARGALIPGYPVEWRSTSRAAVDTVLPTGQAVVVGWGTTNLIARAGTAADTVTLTATDLTRLYVSNAYFRAPRVGTLARPYPRIQDGVDAADAGDTVVIQHGLGRYSESINLVRRIVLLGDSTAFVGGGRRSVDLPLISHDTGAAAIRAHTSAPVAIKYLAITHTLDGPALDADGSDVQLEFVAVNRPGSVTSPIGKGLSIANSNAGSSILWSRVYNVTGYGIRLYHVNGGSVAYDSVDMVLAAPDGSDGSGIRATGGGVGVWGSTLRRTYGPMVYADSVSNFGLSWSDFTGSGGMVRLVDATAFAAISNNVFRLEDVPGEVFPGHGVPVIQILRSRNRVMVKDNTFWGALQFCAPVFCPVMGTGWIASQDQVTTPIPWSNYLEVGRNTFHGGAIAITSASATISTYQNRADSVAAFYDAQGSDELLSDGDTVNASTEPCIRANGSGGASTFVGGQYTLRHALLNGCALWHGPGAIAVDASGVGGGAALTLTGVRVTGMPQTMTALFIRGGGSLTVDSSRFEGGADTTSPRNDPCDVTMQCAGVHAEAYSVSFLNSAVTGFHGYPGLLLRSSGSLEIQGSLLRGNRFGLALGEGVAVPLMTAPVVNDVFDNDSGGFRYDGFSPLTLPNKFWWGDARGPRGGADPAATGDTVVSTLFGPVTVSAAPAPLHVGTLAAALRAVRGDAQTVAAGAMLPKAFTVRVVDGSGLPVPGVSVQFTVTGGGGNFGGQGTATVTTNASGLAEATLTLGAVAGPNTVRVSAGGAQDITFTATGT